MDTTNNSAATATPSADVCAICLGTAQARGGVPLYSPGCCGKWFHQSCVDALTASGTTDCPNCRKPLPVSNVAATLPRPGHGPARHAPPAPAPAHRQPPPSAPTQRNSFLGNIFNFGSSRNSSGSNNTNIQPHMIQQQQQRFNSGPPPQSAITSGELMREDPLDPRPAAVSASPIEGGVEGLQIPQVTVSCTPEFSEVGLAAQPSFYAQVSLRYEESAAIAANNQQTALDLVCVLDNSGSMSGRKLDSLKSAMDFVVDRMGPRDRLSVVHFNSYPGGLHGLLRMQGDNKEASKRRLRELRATGGTDILAGMQYGWDVLDRRAAHNPASCMFLLTDGQDRGHMQEKMELARRIKQSGTSLFVFGFGSDHDSEHMAAIADAAEGTFTYIESDDMVVDAFGGTIGTQQGQALSNITLSLQAAEREVQLLRTVAGRYATTLQPDGRAGTVQFLNMYAGEVRDVLVQLCLPALGESVEDYALLSASVTFSVQGAPSTTAVAAAGAVVEEGARLTASSAGPCVVQRLAEDSLGPAATTRDLQVDISLNREQCTAAVTEAVRAADAGNLGVAKEVVAAAKARLEASISYQTLVHAHGGGSSSSSSGDVVLPAGGSTLLALKQELEDALLRVRSRADYDRGGKAMMMETCSANAYQRSTYTKGGRAKKYQTPSSSCVQEQAFASKGGGNMK